MADDRKFTEYLLSETHPVGKGKAKFFLEAGYDRRNFSSLRDQLLTQLPTVAGTFKCENRGGGRNYEAVVRIEATGGRTREIRTFWEVHPQTGTRLITAYPLDSDS